MESFKKNAFIVLGILLLPFLLLAINRLTALFLDKSYTAIDNKPASEHYLLQKVQTKGVLAEQTAYGTEIDSMWVDTIPLTASGETDTAQKPKKVYKSYSGKIHLDTVNNTIKVETVIKIPGKEVYEQGVQQNYFYTLNNQGKVTNISKDSSGFARNCLLLEDQIKPFQPWLDIHQPVYIRHFTKEKFDSGCLNPLRGWGNPNSNNLCYTWQGMAYFNLSFHQEILQFKVPCASEALFFSNDYDFMAVIGYYEVPLRFRKKFDMAFIVHNDAIYLARAKQYHIQSPLMHARLIVSAY